MFHFRRKAFQLPSLPMLAVVITTTSPAGMPSFYNQCGPHPAEEGVTNPAGGPLYYPPYRRHILGGTPDPLLGYNPSVTYNNPADDNSQGARPVAGKTITPNPNDRR